MAVLWDKSLVPWHDASNAPYTGAKAYFFDVGTTTPQITYTDAALSIPHDHPVVALANGWFPPVFLPDQSSHRLRILDGDDNTLWDVDNISVPTTTPPEIPDSETPTEQLFQTGDLKIRWSTTAPTGWVRVNGRTIGSAASGASERANADCEDLFLFLWNNDSSLAVSGGRGGTATGGRERARVPCREVRVAASSSHATSGSTPSSSARKRSASVTKASRWSRQSTPRGPVAS